MTINLAFGQTQKATTETGEKLIIFSDGTWKYEDSIKTINSKSEKYDCSKWIITETDKVDGTISTSSVSTLIISNDGGKKGLGIFMMKISENSLILSIQAVGASNCIDEGAKINILFTDGSRLTLINDGKFNCKGNSTVYFGSSFGKKNELEELKTKKIQTMRVWTDDSYVEKDFTIENQNEFLNVINCLSK